jgi:tRNA (adenine58-N1)-methyltransferase non-catalytic subunit
MASIPPPAEQTVKKGDYCIFVASDGTRTFVEIDLRRQFKLCGKNRVNIGEIVGKPYGSVFEVGKKALKHMPETDHLTRNENLSAALPEDAGSCADNRNLADTGDSQHLSPDDIAKLRESGASGEEIIAALISNSDSWETKTAFSQQKWLARKEQKYAPRVRLCRPDAETVCESYFQKHGDKMGNLRPDSLAQILAFGNVHAGMQVTVFDTCMGVVTAAVTERLGGVGRILCPYTGTHPSMDAMKYFNFSDEISSTVKSFSLTEIGKLEATKGETLPDGSPEAIAARAEEIINDVPPSFAKRLAETKSEQDKRNMVEQRNARITRMCHKPQPAFIRQWLRDQSDSLIICTRFDPTAVLFRLWDTLATSSPFVVFCEFLEPLVQCFRELQKRCCACKLQLSETWTREFQVLPGRTHPKMHMSSASGFILTGIKVHLREDGWKFVEWVRDGGNSSKRTKIEE